MNLIGDFILAFKKPLCNTMGNYFIYLLLMEIFSIVMVEGKHCVYMYESGYKYFQCSSFEYCCGPLCCRSRSSGFFQLWYFWLMIILMMILCSGGGWWYKFRYRVRYRQAMPTIHTSAAPFIYGTGPPATQVPPTYPNPYYPPQPPPLHVPPPLPQQRVPEAMPSDPPPPYCGPPPSYNVAVHGGMK